MGVFNEVGRRSTLRLRISLGLALLALSLAACGGETPANADLTVPVVTGLTEVPAVSNDPALRSKLLRPDKPEVTGQDLKVYTTSRSLADIQEVYKVEMGKRSWLDVSSTIIGSGELGNQGIVHTFEKSLGGDPKNKQAVGIISLSPEEKNPLIDQYRISNAIPKDSNVILIITGAYNTNAPTPSPTK